LRRPERFEVIVVDDKSKNGRLIEDLCNNYSATYLRNTANSSMPQRALARNIGLSNSSGDVVVFSDMDIILPRDAIDRHVSLHRNLENAVVCSQIWNIKRGASIK
jgi:cellulose synthase/poly-beta-1,6-N-acetylglucosamine synthase-like glycosyltransferase